VRRRRLRLPSSALVFVCVSVCVSVCLSLAAAAQVPSKGTLLVASASSSDPDLAATVVLLLRSDTQGAVGLILNQPTPVPLSTIFPKAESMIVYKGGPLRLGINGLIRTKGPRAGLSQVFGDVYLVSSKPDLEAMTAKRPPDTQMRVYVGLCGWTAGQLADELRRGVWWTQAPSAAIVFDPRPDSLWRRLSRRP
jgi:putative transcriptional regulator